MYIPNNDHFMDHNCCFLFRILAALGSIGEKADHQCNKMNEIKTFAASYCVFVAAIFFLTCNFRMLKWSEIGEKRALYALSLKKSCGNSSRDKGLLWSQHFLISFLNNYGLYSS